jgi:nicotinate dehydrogenase subunit A
MATPIALTVNGKAVDILVEDDAMPLLYALRNDLDLHGPRFGCGLGQCGACTVHVDGHAVRSCITPIASVRGKSITTLEGLGTPSQPHPLQVAFIDEQAVQCGYCISGMIMQAADFLKTNPKPSDDEIRAALANNICRCGTHTRIIAAVRRAGQAT